MVYIVTGVLLMLQVLKLELLRVDHAATELSRTTFFVRAY